MTAAAGGSCESFRASDGTVIDISSEHFDATTCLDTLLGEGVLADAGRRRLF